MARYRPDSTTDARIREIATRYAQAVGQAVGYEMRMRCPVDTGELINSISVSNVEDLVQVSVGTDHWRFVEYGTSRMAAQPFIRPALYGKLNVDFQPET